VIDALEMPVSRPLRDHPRSRHEKRRPFVRFFACEDDLSHEEPDAALPDAVRTGAEPFFVIGAMAGG
jgi:molybdopterin synthase sulfur carrier subunit